MKPSPGQLLLLLAIPLSGEVLACTPPFPSEAMAMEGRNVIIGKVESPSSMHLKPDSMPEFQIKIERIETLSGNAPKHVIAVVPCGIPLQIGERVVVATVRGRRYVYPADMYEESYRNVYGRKR